jgi:hypothetical protein
VDPPTIAQSIKILYKGFDEESISYEPWNDHVEPNVLEEATRPSEPTEAKSPAGNNINKANLDLEELSLKLARLNSQQVEQRKCFMCFKVGMHPLGAIVLRLVHFWTRISSGSTQIIKDMSS